MIATTWENAKWYFYNNESMSNGKKRLIWGYLQSAFSFSNEKIYIWKTISYIELGFLPYPLLCWAIYLTSIDEFIMVTVFLCIMKCHPKKLGVWNGEVRCLAQLLKSIFCRLLILQIVVSAIDESLWHLS